MHINTHMVVNFIVLINKYNLKLYCMIFFYKEIVLLVLHYLLSSHFNITI